jgi:hypothetical protein
MRRWTPVLVVVVAVAFVGVVVPRHGGDPVASAAVPRVLVVSMPGVAWDDVDAGDLPNLAQFVDEAAVGQVSTRIGRRGATSTDAYLTMGAGTRSIAPLVDVAVALDPDETYAGVPTADILERRLGRVPDGVAYLAAGAAQDLNERGPYGGEPGRLGDLLGEAGIDRAIVANADAAEGFVSVNPPPDGSYARGAATMVMGFDGIVPSGTVGRGLLQSDPSAPFGYRYDPAAVLEAFDGAWDRDGARVVLVETSDLSRARAYVPRSTGEQRQVLREEALRDSDALLGQLLDRTTPDDAVLVVSPVSTTPSPDLAVVALRAPDVDGGVLRSSTTRRDGYVQLADVAPTVLALAGIDPPEDIEGRAFRVSDRPRSEDRTGSLAEEADAARFRDSLMVVVVPLVIGVLALLALAALLVDRLPRWVGRALPYLAFAALGFIPATFLAARVSSVTGSTVGYLATFTGLALLAGLVPWAAERRRPGTGTIVGLALTVALFTADVLAGGPLQVNAVFGYSLAVGGRFVGLGNLAFALFGAAAVILAALMVERWGRASFPWATALLVGVVLVEGWPTLGADVGGVLSMVPAFGITLIVLSGRRPGPRDLVALGGAALGAVLVFAFVDGTRSSSERTHLARIAEHVVAGRLGAVGDTVGRRFQASFGTADIAVWLVLLGVVAAVAGYVVLVARGVLGPGVPARFRPTPTMAAALGLATLAVVGLVANDSSIAVPATMLIVVAPTMIVRSVAPAGALR